MKQILLSAICVICLSCSVRAQSIANTFWQAHDTSGTPDLYWNWATDTVYFSTDNVTWQVIATFTENGSTMRMSDVVTGSCNLTDTGTYVVSIMNDTMWLSLLNDPCTSRVAYTTTHYWVALPTAIAAHESATMISVTPNPSDGVFTISAGEVPEKIVVTDISGRIISEENPASVKTIIDLGSSPSGVYFVNIYLGEKIISERLVRQ